MAIVNCKECGGTVPTKTNVCLRCGVVQQVEAEVPRTESITKLQGEVEDLKRRLEQAEGRSDTDRRSQQHDRVRSGVDHSQRYRETRDIYQDRHRIKRAMM